VVDFGISDARDSHKKPFERYCPHSLFWRTLVISSSNVAFFYRRSDCKIIGLASSRRSDHPKFVEVHHVLGNALSDWDEQAPVKEVRSMSNADYCISVQPQKCQVTWERRKERAGFWNGSLICRSKIEVIKLRTQNHVVFGVGIGIIHESAFSRRFGSFSKVIF
jgi:hypothetical protein